MELRTLGGGWTDAELKSSENVSDEAAGPHRASLTAATHTKAPKQAHN